MPLVFVESFFNIKVDLKSEVVWAGHPVSFVITVENRDDRAQGPFGTIYHLEDDNGVETDKAECGRSDGLEGEQTWTSDELTVTPTHEGSHTIEIGLYRDGQLIASGTHRFDALVP